MRRIIFVATVMLFNLSLYAQVVVTTVKGDVAVRHGVSNEWLPVRVGDILKPDDSMRSGEHSSATILIDGKRRVVIPEHTLLDVGDLRNLTREELMLKLAMERVRAVPDREQDSLIVPQTTIVHGERKEPNERSETSGQGRQSGLLQLNGARVLFRHGFYGTCALRAKEVFRLYPECSRHIDDRLMVAAALEKVELYGEALTEYHALEREELSRKEKALVSARIEQLKAKSRKSEIRSQERSGQ